MFNSRRRVAQESASARPGYSGPRSRLPRGATLALVAMAVLAAGCSTMIPGPIVADASGLRYAVVPDTGSRQALQDPFNSEAGIKLAPGDVIYSTSINGGELTGNYYLPSANTQRIPLRFVSPGQPLTDSERYFLFASLLAARHTEVLDFQTDRAECRDLLTRSLTTNESLLWNTLLHSMYVRRIAAEVGGAPHLEVYFAKEKINAQLVKLTNAINSTLETCPTINHFLSERNEIAIPFLNKPSRSIASSLFQYLADGGTQSPSTGYLEAAGASRTSASQVELAGVRADTLPGAERLWSLADWEVSGICGRDGNRSSYVPAPLPYRIARVRLHTGSFLPMLFRIDEDDRADFQVQLATENGSVVRRLKGRRRWPHSSLGRSSLRSLTMADVSAIEWTDQRGNGVRVPQCKGK